MKKPDSKGQTIVLFAFVIFVLLAVAVLVLDGGQFYMNRRAAQASADAAALAGSYELCHGGTASSAIARAVQFATTENEGTTASATVAVDGTIQVDVQIHQTSFFAQLFGINDLEVPASASSNCFPPGGADTTLPIAWACKAPVGNSDPGTDCEIQALDWNTEMSPLISVDKGTYSGPVPWSIKGQNIPTGFRFTKNMINEVYVIMDSKKLSFDLADICLPAPGTLNCDIDGDGAPDYPGGGDRSWVLLGDGTGVGAIKKWLEDPVALNIHTWVGGETGNTSLFSSLPYREIIFLPVFDDYADDLAAAQAKAHPQDIFVNNGSNRKYFHIIGFAVFYITCVDDGNSKCPAHDQLVDKGIYEKNKVKSVEGYFISGYPFDEVGGAGGANLGNTIQSLTE
jgi:hypothetical protein